MLFIMKDSHRGLQPSPPHGNPGLDQAWGGSGLNEKPKARGVGLIPHPVTALACGPGRVAGPEAGWVIRMAAALTLQEVLSEVGRETSAVEPAGTGVPPAPGLRPPSQCPCPNLGSPAFAPTHVAELAATAAPGVVMLGQGPLSLLQAERVERVAAHLAEHELAGVGWGQWAQRETERPRDETPPRGGSGRQGHQSAGGCGQSWGSHLMQAFAGTQQAHHRWPSRHRREHAEAAHQPHVLQVTILLRNKNTGSESSQEHKPKASQTQISFKHGRDPFPQSYTLKSTRTRCTPSGDFCFPVQPLGKEAKGPGARAS